MATPSSAPDLVFVHLSDIHFREGRLGDAHDADRPLRNELQLDLRRLRTRFARFDGLIISGDIAFAGKKEEYDYAGSWIESIREELGCDHGAIMITAGNYDVDHASIPADGAVDLLHRAIREPGSLDQYDARLADVLRDGVRGKPCFSR